MPMRISHGSKCLMTPATQPTTTAEMPGRHVVKMGLRFPTVTPIPALKPAVLSHKRLCTTYSCRSNILLDCIPQPTCSTDTEINCGSWAAIPYFTTFVLLVSNTPQHCFPHEHHRSASKGCALLHDAFVGLHSNRATHRFQHHILRAKIVSC
jgi:hypothetical protein